MTPFILGGEQHESQENEREKKGEKKKSVSHCNQSCALFVCGE